MSEFVVVRKKDLEKVLSITPREGKRLLEWDPRCVNRKIPFNILEDTYVENEAEVHTREGDYWECVQGRVVFLVGGILSEPRVVKSVPSFPSNEIIEWKGKEIKEGEEVVLEAGDRLWIPPGVPHSHKVLNGTARLMITKIKM